jgi:hypothetical protein
MTSSFITGLLVTVVGFEFLKYGSLRRKELKWFTERDQKVLEGLTDVVEIAAEIAVTHNLSDAQAYNIAAGFGAEMGSEYLVPHAARLKPLLGLLSHQHSTEADAVTMILQSRLSAKWLQDKALELRTAYGIEVGTATHWQPEFTEELPEESIDALWQFIQNEKKKWKKDPEPTPAAGEKSLGEDSASTVNGSQPTTNNTGETVTGQSNAAPSTTPDSTATTSMTIPATFSSKP